MPPAAHVLEDVLPRGARVLFCGTAAGTVSARVGAPYAGPGNAFWPTLHEVGLLPAPLRPSAFRDAARWGIALTDLDKAAAGSDAEIGRSGFDAEAVAAKVRAGGAAVVAFTSKTAGAAALGGPVDYGPQPGRFGGAEAWVLPSPSGRARRFWDVAPWHALAARVAAVAPVVLCAPDKLRAALDAAAAAAALAEGVRDAGGWPVELPVADGGEGTLDAFLGGGRADAVSVRARDAHGRWRNARIGVLGNGTGAAENGAGAAENGAGAAEDGAGAAEDGTGAAENGTGVAEDGAGAAENETGAAETGAAETGAGVAGDGSGAAEDGTGAAEDGAGPPPGAATPSSTGGGDDRGTTVPGGPTVLVEAAEAIALAAIPEAERDVGRASSAGVGDLLLAALDHGAGRILVAVGGSASVDGGAGMLRALGVDAPADGAGLLAAPIAVDPALPGLDPRLAGVALELLHDVDAPLCGPGGAARRFGPQKGATPEEVEAYDVALARWAVALRVDPDVPGSGAAGGLGLALMAIGAGARPGAEAVLDLVGFAPLAAHADLVLTAEGSVDASTLQGKTVDAVVRGAAGIGTPVAVLGGRVEEEAAAVLRTRGAFNVVALGDAGRPLAVALAAAPGELRAGAASLLRRAFPAGD